MPHCPKKQISTRPSESTRPSSSLTSPLEQIGLFAEEETEQSGNQPFGQYIEMGGRRSLFGFISRLDILENFSSHYIQSMKMIFTKMLIINAWRQKLFAQNYLQSQKKQVYPVIIIHKKINVKIKGIVTLYKGYF